MPGPPRTARPGRAAAVALAALALLVPAAGTRAEGRPPAPPPSLLILESYHRGFPWTDQQTDGALQVLRARWKDLQPMVESLDMKRRGGPEHHARVVRQLAERLEGQPLDGVIVTDDAALEVALEHRQDLLRGVPISFSGINGLTPTTLAGHRRVTGVVEDVDLAGTLSLASFLQPALHRVVVALDRTETSAGIRPRVLEAATVLGPGVELRVEDGLSLAELEALAAGLDRGSALVLASFNRDRLGDYHGYEEVAERVAVRSGAPVYGLWDFQLGHGVVGGSLLGGVAQGRRAAELLLQLLDGAPEVPVDRGAAAVLTLDEAAASRWGLTHAERVPAAPLHVVGQGAGLWQERRGLMSALAAVAAALGFLSLALLLVLRRIRRGEQALRESEERYRSIVDSVDDAIFVHDQATGAVLDVNRRAEELAGQPREALIGQRPSGLGEARTPYSGAEAARWLAKASATGPQRFEWRARRPDGTSQWVEVSLRPATMAGLPRLVVALRDIRERKAAEEERVALQRRLDEAHRLEAIGRLAGGVAHDFNNLLTPILGAAESALDEFGPDHPAAGDLLGIAEAARRGGALTRQLLAFGRRQPLQRRVVDLNAEVTALHAMLRRVIGEDVRVRLALAPDRLAVEADPAQLQQVLLNLAINARDAMPSGGVLTLATRVVPEAGGALAGELVELTVTDTGVGMTEEVRSRIFEPFFTTKGPGQGTGLGLATVLGVVEQHGGTVEVRSALGEGAAFRILLPRSGEPLVQEARPAAPRPAAAIRPITVLLAEDEPAVRRLVEGFLRDAGHTVLAAADGEAALALSRAHQGPIELLVSDVVMPGMNGRQLHEALLLERPELRVVFMSGYPALPGTQEEIVSGGPGAVLAKPFTREELRARVVAALASAPGEPVGAG